MNDTINTISPFREISNIGKNVLVKLTGLYPDKAYTTKNIRNYSSCSNSCNFFSSKPGPDLCPNNQYCREFCEKVVEKVVIPLDPTYKESTNEKYIPGRPGRFTHSQIIQFIYLHFLTGTGGIRSHVSISKTANDLGLCTKTVLINLQKFIEEDLIYTTKIDSNTYSIYLKDVKSYHLSREQGGSGYIPMSKELLLALIDIKNINSLKLEIRKLLKYDSLRVSKDSTKKGAMSFKDIKRFLPGHINYKSILDKIIDGASSIFNLDKKVDENKIEFELDPSYDARVIKKERELEYSINFASILSDNVIIGIKQDLDLRDLVQMSFEYGYKTVVAALKKYITDYYYNNIVANNIGAFVRSLIQRSIVNEISLI